MFSCRTMWNNITWLMIYRQSSAPNAVSSLCRNIPGGCHVHPVDGEPWLREVQRCGRHHGYPLLAFTPSALTIHEPCLTSSCQHPGSLPEGLVFFGRQVPSACVPDRPAILGCYLYSHSHPITLKQWLVGADGGSQWLNALAPWPLWEVFHSISQNFSV